MPLVPGRDGSIRSRKMLKNQGRMRGNESLSRSRDRSNGYPIGEASILSVSPYTTPPPDGPAAERVVKTGIR
jgi:hypothetical protein